MTHLVAQGDLLIERVKDLEPSGQLLDNSNGLTVIAEGELTGHRHAIHEAVTFFRDDALARDVPSGLYVGHLKVQAPEALLRHEEHDAIGLGPGTYRVRRQRQAEPDDVQIVLD